jgi:hypothetical protein
MAFMGFADILNRDALADDMNNDFQSWKGYGSESNFLAYSARLTARKRTRCIIDQARTFVRKTQGATFAGHFPFAGAPVIATSNIGQIFKLKFENPVVAIGLDVEPVPQAVIPGQPYHVLLTMTAGDGTQTALEPRIGNVGNCLFIGTQEVVRFIIGMELRVLMVENNGQEVPVNFGLNRLELVTTDPLIA